MLRSSSQLPGQVTSAPTSARATRRNFLLALPAVAAVEVGRSSLPGLADELEVETPEWRESDRVRTFYKLARF